MKTTKIRSICLLAASSLLAFNATAQVLMSNGTYTENFDSLANSGTANVWNENSTIPGWYASRGAASATAYRAANGSDNAGGLYSFGASGTNERALGSIESNTTGAHAFGVRIVNDTSNGQKDITISYTGEQWRNGGNTTPQPLTFSYRIDSSPITDTDPTDIYSWTTVPELTFVSPVATATAATLDGNDSANRQSFTFVLPGVVLLPGQEIFLRWVNLNDTGNDHGLAIDDLTVSFTATSASATPPSFISQPEDQTVVRGNNASFSVQVSGTAPISYQWYFNGSALPDGTAATLNLQFVDDIQAGTYYVEVSNSAGTVQSDSATLTVTEPTVTPATIGYLRTLMTENYAPSDTTTLFSVEGIVTTHVNLTTPENTQFYLQDDTGGIAVFVSGGTLWPFAGDRVRVVGPLGHFNGLFELNLVAANPTHSVEVLSSGNPLPTPVEFNFSSANNPALMESAIEGSLVVVSNVYLQGGGEGLFTTGGMNVNMTNLLGQVFVLRVDARVFDMVAQPIPVFASSIVGVMGQYDQSSPFDSGYQLLITTYADLVEGTPLPFSIPLNISKNGSQVEIFWTTEDGGYVLQSASAIDGTWETALESPVQNGSTYTVTINSPAGNRFYRLVKP